MNWIDSHCHLTDERLANQIPEILKKSGALGIDFFMLGGVNPQEWEKQIELSQKFSEKFGLCFGLHPYFIAENEDDECEKALDHLVRFYSEQKKNTKLQILGLGETGLDFRPHIMKDSEERQIRFFENQIELADVLNMPLVLHLVQSHTKALTVLDFFGPVKKGGMAHAFSGSLEMAEQFIRRGFLISVGGAVTYDKNSKLQHAVKHLPFEWLVIETDSPDQAPQGWEKGKNDPSSLFEVALKIGQLRGITAREVLEISTHNFRRVFLNPSSENHVGEDDRAIKVK